MWNERGTVIWNKDDNSKRSDEDEDRERKGDLSDVSGDSPPLVPTLSFSPPLLSLTTPNTSFAFLINPTVCHLRDYISDYATCVSVAIITSSILYNVLN